MTQPMPNNALKKIYRAANARLVEAYPEGLFSRVRELNPGKLVSLAMVEDDVDRMWIMARENMGFYHQFVDAVVAWEKKHMEVFNGT